MYCSINRRQLCLKTFAFSALLCFFGCTQKPSQPFPEIFFSVSATSNQTESISLKFSLEPFIFIEKSIHSFEQNSKSDTSQFLTNCHAIAELNESTVTVRLISISHPHDLILNGENSKQQTPMMIELAEPIQKTMIFTFDRFTGNLKSTGAFENEFTSGENVVTMENIPLNPTKQIFSFSENKSTSILFFPKGFPKTIQIFFQALHNQKFDALLHDKTAFLEISQGYLLHTSEERYIRLMSKMDHRKTVTCVENNSSGKMNCRPFGL